MATPRRDSTFSVQGWLKILGAVFAVLMGMVWEHVEALHMERQVKAMHREADRLVYENAQLQVKINQLESPSRLDTIAKTQLGMGPLDARHIIEVDQR